MMITEIEWNVEENWWLNAERSFSNGYPEEGKSEFGVIPDHFKLLLRHYP